MSKRPPQPSALQDLKAGDPAIAALDARLSELLKGDTH